MNPFEFALAIIALAFFYKLVKTMVLHKNTGVRRDDTADADLLARLQQVEERVRVLERIVTDERYDLKQQFKDLGA
jgi:hypothetical protein